MHLARGARWHELQDPRNAGIWHSRLSESFCICPFFKGSIHNMAPADHDESVDDVPLDTRGQKPPEKPPYSLGKGCSDTNLDKDISRLCPAFSFSPHPLQPYLLACFDAWGNCNDQLLGVNPTEVADLTTALGQGRRNHNAVAQILPLFRLFLQQPPRHRRNRSATLSHPYP